jgi:hypothetical protein
MLSFIEIGFYISLAVMLCLLFLLINHLKSRIITLENQNEGMMDVMKMIRGNLVNSDKEQKQIKESISSLAKNVSQVSNVVSGFERLPLERNNITLEVEDLSFAQGNISQSMRWGGDSEEDETEDETQEMGNEIEENEAEVVNIDWPSNEEIEIRKLTTEDLSEYDDPDLQKRIMEMAQLHISTPMYMNSSDASDIQKMFFMMSMSNGVPMSNIVFENTRDYSQLPETYDDPEVEQLPESPMPELIPIDSEDKNEPILDEQDLHARIDDLIAEITTEDVEPTEAPAEEVVVPPVENVEPTEAPVEEVAVPPMEDVESTAPVKKEENSVDFSKMDLRTLRSLVSTQGKVSHEKVAKMKKAELVRLLSSSSE